MKQDIFKSDAQILVCPVNNVGVMGAGLALQFAKRVDGLESFYKDACKRGYLEPGELQFYYDIDANKHVCLFPTKRDWRKPSRLEDIDKGLEKLRYYMDFFGDEMKVAIPRIGCGLGSLPWEKVKPLIQKRLLPSQYILVDP